MGCGIGYTPFNKVPESAPLLVTFAAVTTYDNPASAVAPAYGGLYGAAEMTEAVVE